MAKAYRKYRNWSDGAPITLLNDLVSSDGNLSVDSCPKLGDSLRQEFKSTSNFEIGNYEGSS